jgi:hypothetical protein
MIKHSSYLERNFFIQLFQAQQTLQAYSPRNPNGQDVMADSEPVVIASDQSAVPVTGTVAATQSGAWNITNVSGTVSLPTGASTLTEQQSQTTLLSSIDGSTALLAGATTTLGSDTYTEATSLGVTIGAVRRDADTTLVGTTNEFAPLQVDANGRLKVEAFSGETLPVSLTSTTITGTVTVSATDLDIRNLVAATDIVDLGGNALTSLQLIDDAIFVDDTATHSTGVTKGMGIMAVAVPTDTSISANDIGMVAMTTDRRLLVDASGVAVPITDNSSSISVDWNGTQPVTGSGTATGALRVELANNGTGVLTSIGSITSSIVPGTGATNLGKAEDAQHTTGDVGVMALGVRAASPTERSAGPTDGDYEPFATNEVGAVWVSETPSANGGASTMNATSSDGGTALTSTAQAIKASAGCVYGYYIYNPNATAQFVQFYNTASGSVTVGTTNPLFMLTIPATSGANLFINTGIQFSTAISWAATSTAGGNGAPTTALDAVAWYK